MTHPEGGCGRWGRRFLRLPLFSLLAWGLLLLLSSVALAHAQVISTDPVDGARLPVAPAQVSVTFNEPVTLAPGGLRVVRSDGTLADVGEEVDQGTTVSQAIGSLTDGWYVMAWSIVSEDGHVVHGSATFAVGDAAAASRPATPFATPLQLVLWIGRGLADLATLVAGGAAIAWCVLGARTGRVRRLWLGAVVGGIVASAAWLGIELSDAGTEWLSTEYAIAGVAHLVMLAVALTLLLLRPSRPRAAAVALAVAVGALGWGGHATGSLIATLALTAHLLAAVTWLGAAPAVALVLWDRAADDATAADVVRGFSRLATVALVVLILGGSTAAWLLTDGLAGGLTGYVQLLALKVIVVAVAATGGVLGRRALGGFERRRYRLLFLLDAVLLCVVVALSSALNLVGPHEGMGGHDMGGGGMGGSPRCALILSGGGGAAFIADPGTPGANSLLVTGPEATAHGVSVSLVHPFAGGAAIEVPLTSSHHGWEGSAALPFTGTWTATVAVRVDEFTESSGSCDFQIVP